jgi:hypothetical protein
MGVLTGPASSTFGVLGAEWNQPPGKKRDDDTELFRVRVEALSERSTAASGVSSGLQSEPIRNRSTPREEGLTSPV